MTPYLLHGKLIAKPNQQKALADILIEASELLVTAKGCKLYVVGLDESESDSVYITEIWENKTDHENSLKIEGVRKLIMKAMPLLGEQPNKGQEISIIGGLGI